MRILIALLALSAAPAIFAQQSNCKDPETQMEMNLCSGQAAQRADVELNRIYQATIKRLDSPSADQLRAVQRAWLQYRDLQCKADGAQYEGGSIQPLIVSSCLQRLTSERTKVIKDTYQDH